MLASWNPRNSECGSAYHLARSNSSFSSFHAHNDATEKGFIHMGGESPLVTRFVLVEHLEMGGQTG